MGRDLGDQGKRHPALSAVPRPNSPAGRYFDYASLGLLHPKAPAARYFDHRSPSAGRLLAWNQPGKYNTAAPAAEAQGDGRKLTKGEINLAKSIFGDRINYEKVTIYHKRFIFFQPKDRLMTPNGNIYAAPGGPNYSEDYSTISEPQYARAGLTYSQAEFIHEMTHVWQHQAGVSVEFRGLFERNYYYDFATLGQKDFIKYGIEEQAQMVEDYYILRHGGSIYRGGQGYAKDPPPLATYEKVLKPYFPLEK